MVYQTDRRQHRSVHIIYQYKSNIPEANKMLGSENGADPKVSPRRKKRTVSGTPKLTLDIGVSEPVARGVKWLAREIQRFGNRSPSMTVPEAFVISKVCAAPPNIIKHHISGRKIWEDDDNWFFDDPHRFFYLSHLRDPADSDFALALDEYVRDWQTFKGRLMDNEYSHVGAMRALIAIDPAGQQTSLALKWFVENLMECKKTDEQAIALLALLEADSVRFKPQADWLAEQIVSKIGKRMSKSEKLYDEPESTALAIQALYKADHATDPRVKGALASLRRKQSKDGSWPNGSTPDAILALITAGGGPSVSREELDLNRFRYETALRYSRPHLVLTDPTKAQRSIRDWLVTQLPKCSTRLWICSRYITEFWTDLVNLRRDKPEVDIRIITIPRKEAKSIYVGAGKKSLDPAIDTLEKAFNSSYRETPLLHARAVLIDDAVLISSADLSSEQLDKEFNLGFWTRDVQAVSDAAAAFDSFWTSLAPPAETREHQIEK